MIDHSKIEKDIKNYFKEVYSIYLHGDYTEWTYRTPFENFIKRLNPDYNLTQEPKRAAGLGAPDFKAFYNSRKIGFIETKDLGENLDKMLETEQLKKYIESIDNLILTNYLQFVLIRKGRKVYDCNLFMLSDLDKRNLSIRQPAEKIETFSSLINGFFEYKLPTIVLAEELAVELSKRAKLLKELAKDQLLNDLEKIKNNESPSSIYDFYLGIKELIKDVKLEDCADAYAQTITYGLFLAKRSCRGKLDRRTASYYIPKNVGVIKRIFLNISGEEFPPNISWIVDDIIDILNAAKLEEILSKIDKRGKKDKDPIIFFYEDFLNYYEPEKRKHLGVYYTPRPVVNFIVNSVHSILKKHFDKSLGLADDSVNVLDPAIGTGTFFWITFLVALGELKNQGLRGIIFDKIENHLLKHFYGFEILITPYVISHLKITDLLQRWHYRFKDDDRIQVYLTNTLEQSEVHDPLLFMREITEESRIANQIKTEKPILAVMGNPPYSVSSSNKSKWIMEKMEDYKKNLNERNIQPLDDDYIKFIRFAQWKIDKNGQGIVGFITNNSYLDGIIHRRMRKELLNTFDRIYILNLHGDSRKKETCPDGSKDENVFDIRQGVAIALFVKNDKFKDKKVLYADLYGEREDKYLWLDRNGINTIRWQELKPKEPYYFFTKKDFALSEEYDNFYPVKNIFQKSNMGVATGKDNVFVDFSDKNLLNKLSEYEPKKESIKPYYYRPFDKRFVYYDNKILQRARYNIMKHFLSKNIGLCIVRQAKKQSINCLVTEDISCRDLVTNHTYVFPLYIYNETKEKSNQINLNNETIEAKTGKQPNFTSEFLEFIDKQYPNQKIAPEDILGYIYAVLHSPTYRQKFNEFLKIDFPRIPFVDDYEEFKKLAELGKELVELHLMRKRLPTKVKFDLIGSNIVEKVKYENGKVWINKEQYFEGVPEEIWDFYIGGYQVLDKWLKSRKNRKLESKDIEQFLQIVEIIGETIRLMKEIDKVRIF